MLNNNTSNNNTSADSTFIGFLAKARNKKVQKRIISLLSVVVLLLTLNQTKLIADTLQRIPMCGIAEHTHEEACVNEAGEYICGLEEHVHTDACYQQRPTDIEEVVEAEELETDGLEAPVAEISLELNDEGEIAEPASTVDDEAVVSGDVEEIPAETVVELGEGEVTVDDTPLDTIAVMPAESEASSPVFDFEGRDYVALSEILPVLPLQMEEVVDVLAVLDEDQETSPIIIEKVEQDYTIYVIERFAWTDIAVETAEGLKTITLIDGGTREEDLRVQTEEISVAAEETAEGAEVQSDGGSEEQTVGTAAESEEQTVAAPTEVEEEQTVVAPTEGEEEQTETVPAEGDKEQSVAALTEDKEERTVDATAEVEEEQTVAAPTEGEEEQTVDAAAEGAEQAVAALTEGEEEQDGEGQSDEEATEEGTDDHTDGDEEGDMSVAVEGAEDEEQTGESSAEDGSDESEVEDETEESKAEGDDVVDEVQEPQTQVVADGFHTVIDLSEVEALPLSLREIVGKMEAEQSVLEQSTVEPAVTEETYAPQPEVIEEQIAEDAQSFEADDERPLDAQADDGQFETLTTENIESVNVEPAAEEVVVELGEEQADDTVVAKAASDNTTVDYDSALLSLTPIMEGETVTDYSIDVIADFDSTDIIVDSQYTITLLNGVNPWPAQSFTDSTEYMNVSVTADVGAFPAGTTMEVSDVVDDETISGIADSVNGNFVEVERVHAVDISFKGADGQEIEPRIPISVVMTVKKQIAEDRETVVVHMDNEGEASVVETAPVEPETELAEDEAATVAFTSDSFSVYAVVVTRKLETNVLASDGENYKIEVTYGPDAGIPDGAVLAVSEVTEDEEYRAQVEAGLAGNKMITLARFFDIKIMDGEEEIHPAEAVEVRVWLEEAAETPEEEIPTPEEEAAAGAAEETAEGIAIELGEDGPDGQPFEAEEVAEAADDHIVIVGEPVACAAHFAGESAVDVLDAAQREEAVVFMAEGFSVWGVVYTVDFYLGDFEYHLPGEGYITLSDLFEELEIEADAAQATDVMFTNPELVAVVKVEEDTALSQIKAELGNESVNGDAEGEEQPEEEGEDEIIPAGTWLLVSLAPFDTEEKLTVTMEDGTVYEIRVEDDATDYTVLVNDRNGGYIGEAGSLHAFQKNSSGVYTYVQDVQEDGEGHVQFFKHKAGQSAGSLSAVAKSGYDFVFWLVVQSDGTMLTINGTTLITGQMTYTNALYIPCFAPTGAKLIIRGLPQPSSAWHYTPRNVVRYVYYTYQNDDVPRYNYSTDNGGTIEWQTSFNDATSREQYNFLGWFNQNRYISKGYDINDGYIKHNFKLSDVTEHTILIPKYELKPEYRNYLNVWFDGTNGVYGGEAPNNTFYTRIESTGRVRGSTSVLQQVYKSNSGSATFTLPTTADDPQSQGDNHFELQGWYDIYNKRWYAKGATVTITSDSVFYADWMPTNYSASPASSVSSLNTNNFITTRMFDYNNLFNMDCIELDSDRTYVNKFANSERWKMKGNEDDFIFITKVAGAGKSVMPDGRTSNNTNNETTTNGTYYSGQVSPGLLSESLSSRLFGTSDGLGKRYLGTANYLYQYDNNTGYYYYDSDKNAASYDKGGQRFYVYGYTNATDKSNNLDGDFLPYNYGQSTFTEAYGAPNYWFGMSSQIDFFLPNAAGYTENQGVTGNRSIKGDEMVYKFAGDDDVWVFVDGQLVLDMGGVHGKVYGEINFSQGTWAVVSDGASKVNDAKGIMSYEVGTGAIQTGTLNLAEGDHKLTLYYLERGSSQSNCAIYFNLAPRYALQFHKVDSDSNEDIKSDVTFGVFTDPDCTVPAQLKDLWGNTTHLFTATDGWKHATGLLAGHTYYIKEVSAPAGYPDVSSEVITLKIKTDGTAEASSTADVAGDSGWKMTEVTSSEDENSTNKGTFMIGLKIKNRKNTSISARKIWGMLDGNVETNGGRHTEVKVKLQRYSLTQTTNDQNGIHYTVTVVPRFFASNGKPTNRDDGTLVRLGEPSTVPVPRDGSVTFTASANGEHAGIHSIIGPNMSAENLTNTTEKFFINSSWETAMKSGEYTASHIRQDTTIYVNFIGSGESVGDLNADISTLTAQNADGNVTYSRQPDATFNAQTTYNDQTLEQTLEPANNWTCTWDNLPVSENGIAYYYYVEEVPVEHQLAENETLDLDNTIPAYVATYSSDGLSGGGTIAVRNNVKANKIRLRKQDDDPEKHNLAGAQFQIYLASEYEKADGKPLTVSNNSQWMDEETYDTEAHAFVSNNEGKFFSGYLPKGTYYLVETKSPDGYARVDGAITIVVDDSGMLYKLPGAENYVRAPLGSDGYYSLYIVDPLVVPVDITIAKVIKGTTTPLIGATFKLTRVDSNNNVITGTDAVEKTETVVSDGENMGKAIFTGMTYGRYRLEETVVPDGYVKLEGPYYITIDAKGNHSLDETVAHNLIRKDDDNVYTVENEPGVRLPSTGGPGTTFFYVFGSLLTLFATALLLRRKHDY